MSPHEPLGDEQLLRYSRQIMLPQWDVAAQERILASRVLIVGAGGLGCPVAMYLAAAGVGTLLLADDDTVDLSNLQRQIAHTQADIGRAKVDSLRDTLLALNPDVMVETIAQRLDETALPALLARVDVVVDASDNAATRFAINRACVQASKPLVSGAAIRMEGQLAVFDPRTADAPCYACLYSENLSVNEACVENGVLSPVVGVIGSLQAVETLKVLAGVGDSLAGRLLVYDGMSGQMREFRIPKDPACTVCSKE
ncbi:MAG: molybdopterin-synthase adenylyltransferase MoeB [Gammaproteobacteria bacterium]|nr:MAG: molybdopterin-synthase adenylyltransferase MoeB [Gammaproteobacteria bacterium]